MKHFSGLISYKKSGHLSGGWFVEEEWDLTVPDCPIMIFKVHPEFKQNDEAMVLRRAYVVPYDK